MNKMKIGLALGSGAWRGLAHIGVIKSLEKNNIPIDYIAGSSTGALIGGLYAAIGNSQDLEKIVNSLKYRDLFRAFFGKGLGIKGKKYKEDNLEKFFKEIVGDVRIENLKIKFCAVAADAVTGKMVVIDRGSLAKAIRASTAIPLIFRPVEIENYKLIDGAVLMPIPVAIAKNMGADKVIGVNLYGNIFPLSQKISRISRILMAKIIRFMPLKTLADENLKNADIVVVPKIENDDYGFFGKFLNNKTTIKCGEEEMDKQIKSLKIAS